MFAGLMNDSPAYGWIDICQLSKGVTMFKRENHYWTPTKNGLTQRQVIKQEIEKLKSIRYVPDGDKYRSELRDPKEAPSVDEVVENIMEIIRGENVQT